LIPIEKKSEWSPEPEEPDFEYDLESSESDDSDSDVNPVVVATFVGGVILTGTLGFLVYRGLNSA